MADKNVEFHFRISDDGTLSVIDKASGKVQEFATRAERASRDAGGGFTRLQATIIATTAGIELARRAISAIEGPIRAVITASLEQDKATRLLNAQLQQSGQFSQQYSRQLQAQASELQKLTAVSDETILGIQRQATAFGATEKNMRRVTLAVLNLAQGMKGSGEGEGVESASLAVAKALQGQTITLSKLGIQVDATASKSEKFEQVLSGIETRFGGAAAAAAQTFEGRIRGLSLALGDLLEPIGDTVTQSKALQDVIARTRGRIEEITKRVDEWVKANRELIDDEVASFFASLESQIPNVASGLGTLATNTSKFVDALSPFFKFATDHPALALALFGLGGTKGLAVVAGAGVIVDQLQNPAESRQTGGGFSGDPNTAYAQIAARVLGARGRGRTSAADIPIGGNPFVQLPSLAGIPVGGIDPFGNEPRRLPDADEVKRLADAQKKQREELVKLANAETEAEQAKLDLLTAEQERTRTILEGRAEIADTLGNEQEALAAKLDLAAKEIDFARAREAVERKILEAKRAELEVGKTFLDASSGDVARINAELAKVDAALAGIGIETAKAEVNFEKVTAQIAAARREAEQAKRVVFDFGASLEDAIGEGLQGILSRDSGRGLLDQVKATGQALVTEFTSSFIKAELAKRAKLDVPLTENFSVTLPDLFSSSADSLTSSFGDAFSSVEAGGARTSGSLASSFGSALSGIGRGFAQLGSQVAGVARNVPGLRGLLGEGPSIQSQLGGGTQYFPQTGADAQTVAIAAGAGQSGVLGGGAAPAGASTAGLGGATAALGIIGAVVAVAQAVGDSIQAGRREARRFGATDASVAGASTRALPIIGDLAKSFGVSDEKLGKFQNSPGGIAFNVVFNPLGLITLFSNQAPTRGTQSKAELSKILEDAGLPRQREFTGGGRAGVRVPRLEEAPTAADIALFGQLGFVPGRDVSGVSLAERTTDKLDSIVKAAAERPEVSAIRGREGLGLFSVLFPDPKTIAAATNAFTNNALLLGQSAEETTRQLRKLAEASGVTLVAGLEELARKEREGDISGEILKAGVEGLVALFEEDIPAGIDVASLALSNYSEKGGLDIANLTDELEKQINLFGRLQQAVEGAFGNAIGAGIQGFREARQALEQWARGEGGTGLGDVLRAQDRARASATVTLGQGIVGGLQDAFTQNIFDTLDTPGGPFETLKNSVADAVNGGGIPDVDTLVTSLLNEAIPAMQASAEILEEINSQFAELDDNLQAALRREQLRSDLTSAVSSGLQSILPQLADPTQTGVQRFENLQGVVQIAARGALQGSVGSAFLEKFAELPAFSALIDGADNLGNIGTLVDRLVTDSLPLFQTMTQSLAEIEKQIGLTPLELRNLAADIRGGIDAAVIGGADRDTGSILLRSQLGDTQRQIDQLTHDAIDDKEQAAEIRSLVEKQSNLGFQLLSTELSGLTPGTERYRAVQAQIINSFIEPAAVIAETLADTISNVPVIVAPSPEYIETSASIAASNQDVVAVNRDLIEALRDLARETRGGRRQRNRDGGGETVVVINSDDLTAQALNEMIQSGALSPQSVEVIRGYIDNR